jgi:hypothetical protein
LCFGFLKGPKFWDKTIRLKGLKIWDIGSNNASILCTQIINAQRTMWNHDNSTSEFFCAYGNTPKCLYLESFSDVKYKFMHLMMMTYQKHLQKYEWIINVNLKHSTSWYVKDMFLFSKRILNPRTRMIHEP